MSTEVVEVLDTVTSSFDPLFKKAEKIDDLCYDYNVSKVSNKNLSYLDDGGVWLKCDHDFETVLSPTDYAFNQLCTKLGVPTKYVLKCQEADMHPLASDNVNAWINRYGKNLFVRRYDDYARGFLSDRYTTLDTPQILSVLDNTLNLNEYSLKGSFIDFERFHARFVSKEPITVGNEVLFTGFQVDSSDVGRAVLSVRFFIYRQVCTNGMIVTVTGSDLFHQKHMGITMDDFNEGLVASVKEFPSIVERAEYVIRSSQNKKLKVTEIKSFIESIKSKTRLPDDSVEKVVDLMRNTYSFTNWGYANAVTQVAQDFTLDRRIELETVAGGLLVA